MKPWTVSVEEEGHNPSIYIEADDYGTIAQMGGGLLPIRLANAQLIVRAVNAHASLLAALEGLLANVAPHDPGGWHAITVHRSSVEMARAAIAAAKGG